MVIFGVDSIFGSKNVISESSELSSFSISAKTKKRCFWMFSQSIMLGTTSYLVKMPEVGYIRLRAFVLKCRFDIDFGC